MRGAARIATGSRPSDLNASICSDTTIVPSSAVETMGLGALSGIAALAKGEGTEAEAPEKKREE